MAAASTTRDLPAIEGGTPVRSSFLPVARPHVHEEDIAAVVATLRSGWLATGPRTAELERAFAGYVGTAFAVGVTSGTAALELALEVAGIGPSDEVITTPLTFAATAHAIYRRGARPVFADIDPRTWNLDPTEVERRCTARTRAIVPVHFGGRPCDMRSLADVASRRGLALVSDSAHSIEARCGGRPLADWFPLSAYSFHPVKNLTTGEGGMVATDDAAYDERLRLLRLHGIASDAWARHSGSTASCDVVLAGLKCNMSDVQASLGLGQVARLETGLEHREALSSVYDHGLRDVRGLTLPVETSEGDRHARHLYCVVVDPDELGMDRDRFRAALRAENIGTAHHYVALPETSFYRELCPGDDAECPHGSSVSRRIVSLPLHGGMTRDDARDVVEAVRRIVEHAR